MLYREIIAVCSQSHTKHINTLCGQNVEVFTFKAIYIYYTYNIEIWGTSISWNPLGLSRPVMGLLYLYFTYYIYIYIYM